MHDLRSACWFFELRPQRGRDSRGEWSLCGQRSQACWCSLPAHRPCRRLRRHLRMLPRCESCSDLQALSRRPSWGTSGRAGTCLLILPACRSRPAAVEEAAGAAAQGRWHDRAGQQDRAGPAGRQVPPLLGLHRGRSAAAAMAVDQEWGAWGPLAATCGAGPLPASRPETFSPCPCPCHPLQTPRTCAARAS